MLPRGALRLPSLKTNGSRASRAVAVCILALAHQPCLSLAASPTQSSAKPRAVHVHAAFAPTHQGALYNAFHSAAVSRPQRGGGPAGVACCATRVSWPTSALRPGSVKPLGRTRTGVQVLSGPADGAGREFPEKLAGVLFDMDGTLSDSESLHWGAYRRVFARMVPDCKANPISREFYNANMGGKTKMNALAEVLPDASDDFKKQICTALEDEFNILAKTDLTPLPGLTALLDSLKGGGVRMALVTNAPPSEMTFGISCLGLVGRFEALVPSAECSHGKPHPAPYIEGLRRLGLEPGEAIAVEDSLAGVQSAVAAGLFTVGVTTSRSAGELEAEGAGLIIADFTDKHLLRLCDPDYTANPEI